MRCASIMTHTCQYCGKHVHLCERDFFASIGPSGKVNYFFECPNCQEVDKVFEECLPGYLKDKLVAEAKIRHHSDRIYLYGAILFFVFAMVMYFTMFK